MPYYCARLLVVCLVDDGKPRKKNICDYPFVFIKANDYEEAFQRAIVLGKQHETQYKNAKDQAVRWAFIKVEEIKELPRHLDGVEVGSLLDVLVTDSPVPFSQRFSPRRSRPMLT